MTLYADTSALIKLVLEENGSDLVRAAVDRDGPPVVAVIGYVELRAAVAAAVRDGRLMDPEGAKLRIEQLWEQVSEVVLDPPLLRRAGALAEQHGLRGYDAVHLAAAMTLGQPGSVTLVCFDEELRRAATGLGFQLLPSS